MPQSYKLDKAWQHRGEYSDSEEGNTAFYEKGRKVY
jgi:hypothetical protein